MNKFAENLKIYRTINGIAQKDLAKVLGVTQSVVSKMEIGIQEPTLDILIKIADFFEISTDELLGRNENTTHY